MIHQVIRNKKQLHDLKELLDQERLPFKITWQTIYPIRTLDSNDYLWAVVYTTIAEATGQSPEEVHEGYKIKYNFRFDLEYNTETKRMEWITGVGSTTKLDMQEIWNYILKVRADAELELGVVIPMPNEVFVNELKYSTEPK